MTETVAISPAAALLLQGRTLHQQGALAAARQLYDQALVLDPHDVDAHYLLAVLAVAAALVLNAMRDSIDRKSVV